MGRRHPTGRDRPIRAGAGRTLTRTLRARRSVYGGRETEPSDSMYVIALTRMTTDLQRVVRLQIRSTFEMLDFVQVVSDELGNREDASKTVTIEFALDAAEKPTELTVRVMDQGKGFEAEAVADPLAPENLLKSSGRGIFFMRSFMDDVQLHRIPEGGMEVRMVKKFG